MGIDAPESMSLAAIALLKGVVYRENDEDLWHQTISRQAALRDWFAVIGLDVLIDEAEGYAWLRTRPCHDGETALPRLMARRQLPYLPSLLLALLRKKLAESDASGDGERVILSREDLVDLVRIFLPAGSNDARLSDQVMAAVNRLEESGFVRRLKNQDQVYEARRVIKAFVDAQWLSDFDQRLSAYRTGIAPAEDES